MEAIAARAGVSKETLYRWWRSKADVLLDALVERGERQIPIPNSGHLDRDLRTFMRATARALDRPTRQVLRTLAAQAATDEQSAEQIRDRFLSSRRAALASVLGSGEERGEFRGEQVPTALDLVFGSLWYRLVFGIGSLDEQWADSVTDALVLNPGASSPRRPSPANRPSLESRPPGPTRRLGRRN